MRTNFLFFLIIINLATVEVSFSQKNSWLKLTYPQALILGKAIDRYKNGEIDLSITTKHLQNLKIDTIQSADNVEEYNKKFRNFVSRYFTSSRASVNEVKAKNLIIKNLNIASINEMKVGKQYVYAGLSADSVTVIGKMKKEKDINISKALKDVSKTITSDALTTKIVDTFLDSITYKSEDSVYYKMTLANPEVYYQVKIVTLKKGNHNWEKYYKYFSNIKRQDESAQERSKRIGDGQHILGSYDQFNTNPDLDLIYTPRENTNKSEEIYPEFWGKDLREIKFKFIARKINNDLKLYISNTTGEVANTWVDTEVPYKIEDGKKYWILDKYLAYFFDWDGITKMVYITLDAEKIDDNTIRIHNHDSQKRLTYMEYPAIKFKYIYK